MRLRRRAVESRGQVSRRDRSGPLIERNEMGGPRHFLAGQPVHAGTGLELHAADGSWLAGRYEWSFAAGEAPVLHVDGLWGDVRVPIGDLDELRWPLRWFGRP